MEYINALSYLQDSGEELPFYQVKALVEKEFQKSINEILETTHATTIIIAHRLSTLAHMDRIIVLEQGAIVQQGSHAELLAQPGLYRTLWEAQINGFLPEK